MLTWNANLAGDAQAWANALESQQSEGCAFVHDPSDTNQGENLAKNSSTDPNALARTPEEVLQAWWDEEEAEAEAGDLTMIGHFTQAAWYGTTEVGCGFFNNDEGTGICHVQVCRYYAPGNCNVGDWSNWKALTLAGSTACADPTLPPPPTP